MFGVGGGNWAVLERILLLLLGKRTRGIDGGWAQLIEARLGDETDDGVVTTLCFGSAVAGHRSAAESRHDRSRDTTTQKVLTATVEDQVPAALIATAPLSPLRTPLSGLQPSAATSMAAMSAAAQHQVDRLAATAAVARKLGRATKGDAGMARPALRAASQPLPVPQPKAEEAYEGDGEVAAIYEDEVAFEQEARPSYWETVRHRHLDNVALSRSLRCAAVEAVGLTSGVADLDGGGGRTFGDSELEVFSAMAPLLYGCAGRSADALIGVIGENGAAPDTTLSARAMAFGTRPLLRLQLASNGLTDCGADSVGLAALGGGLLAQTSFLGLSGNQLQLHKCPSLTQALREPSATAALTDLDLSINRVHDRGAVAVFGALGAASLPSLGSLRLDSNRIGDDGVRALAQALLRGAMPSLALLDLAGNRITDGGLSTLVRTACERGGRLMRLGYLDVSSNLLGVGHDAQRDDLGDATLASALAGGHMPLRGAPTARIASVIAARARSPRRRGAAVAPRSVSSGSAITSSRGTASVARRRGGGFEAVVSPQRSRSTATSMATADLRALARASRGHRSTTRREEEVAAEEAEAAEAADVMRA